MDTASLLQKTLDSFSECYDIERDAQILGRKVDALAQMRALNSKYILSKKHVLWEANAFEHMLILCEDELTEETVTQWFDFLTREAEPWLVHPGTDCPPEGHMYSFLTLIFLCNGVRKEAVRAVRKAKFSKNYRFSLRGWATGRLLAVDLSAAKVYANAAGREMEKHFRRLLEG